MDLAPARPGGLILKNPIMTAAGPFGFGKELARLADLAALGAFVTRGVTLHPRAGGDPPRLDTAPAGVLHSIGRPNPGLRAVIRDMGTCGRPGPRPACRSLSMLLDKPLQSVLQWGRFWTARRASPAWSWIWPFPCRQTPRAQSEHGDAPEAAEALVGHDAALTWQFIHALRETCSLPVLAKLPPRLPGPGPGGGGGSHAGADAVTLCGPWPALGPGPRGGGLSGAALSGPAVRPLVLRCLWEVARTRPGLPLVASGGVESGADAAAYLDGGRHGRSGGRRGTSRSTGPLAGAGRLGELLAEGRDHEHPKPGGSRRMNLALPRRTVAAAIVFAMLAVAALLSGCDVSVSQTPGVQPTQPPVVPPTPDKIEKAQNRVTLDGRVLVVKDGNVWVLTQDAFKQISTGGKNRQPTWSPDGRQVAFVKMNGSSSELWMMNADGSGARAVASS